jgi:predicted Rossmann fold flavoprotein
MIYDIAIIGAGASGLMLASHIKNQSVILIDSNASVGEKIKVSGGGKCNITNKYMHANHYLGDENFIQTLLDGFTQNDLLQFLKHNGVYPNLDEKIVKGTYFCNASKEVIAMFKRLTQHCTYALNTKVSDVVYNKHFYIHCNNKIIEAKKLVVASGGLSYERLGASSIAFNVAKKFGHTVLDVKPALVGFTVQKEQFWFKDLSGISLDVKLKVNEHSFEGGLLFAHKGFSGPVVLNGSLYWQKGLISIDFMPKQQLKSFLKSNKIISKALPLPKRFIQSFLKAIQLEDKPMSQLNNKELERLHTLKNYEFAPAGNFGFSKAEVTKGGICTDEIKMQSMQSTLVNELYFLGECLNVTGELGGYNFQFAFSSAMQCAKNL